jgi:ParB family chromosome partitioning protein
MNFDEDDLAPLLQATASRSLDTCLRGARGLAVLGDPRAFGLLLQLSREDGAAARVEVCRALAALDDPRALKRLRSLLYDSEAAVRDAAFTALAAIHQDDPLLPAEAGLSAAYEDVRRRGLQVLVQQAKKSVPKKADDRAWQLLVRALNDSFPAVRSEAFKACLNLKIAGGGVGTHRFVLQSVHADVRLEVLTEMQAQANEDWAWNLLLEFFNDPDPYLRKESFGFAVKKTKELPPLEIALASHYTDVRKLAVDALVKKHTKPAQELLVRSLADPDKEVRQLALKSLVDDDARPALTDALASPNADVRLGASMALARHGDGAALAPLLTLATAPEPAEKERIDAWQQLVVGALGGLANLANGSALSHVVPLLQARQAEIRKAAIGALVRVSRPDAPEALRQAVQHADPQVKYRAALGLAFLGDPLAASLVFTTEAAQVLAPISRLAAAHALGPAGEDQLTVFLDDPDDALRQQALVLMMLLEMAGAQETPTRCLACLAAKMPRVRLMAGRGLESFADADSFTKFVVELVNDRGDEPAWKIPQGVVEALAELLTHAPLQLRADMVLNMSYLGAKEQVAWDESWGITTVRCAGTIAALRQAAAKRKPLQRPSRDALRQLAFGAYVGLVREQAGRDKAAVIRVRQTALSRIMALATADDHFKRAAVPVFVQSLGDPNQSVRGQAFEHLQNLGMDRTALGGEALETGHTDLGVKGLELLSGGTGSTEGQAILERVMLTRDDNLAIEAAKLLLPPRGVVGVASAALTAVHDELRQQGIAWLTADYEKSSAAQDALRKALGSRYPKVRQTAAYELAGKKDAAAFPALAEMLAGAEDAKQQRRVITALVTLGDPRAIEAMLNRLQNDPAGTALGDDLLKSIAQFRKPDSVPRLLGLLVKGGKWLKNAFQAIVIVSGYDQAIDDPEDETPTPSATARKQHPRHDSVLAKLLERTTALGDTRLLGEIVPWARWAKGPEVQAPLAGLATYPDEDVRHAAVEALGWRLRKRSGDADVLVKALSHRDPQTQFLAAEGLARGKRADGIGILLSSIDFQSDYDLRQRAVQALGELGDARALDPLLKLANEDGHALQDEAAEALGHMGRSEKGDEIGRLLERFVRSGGSVAEKALRGLRWLNTAAAWQLIRQQALGGMHRDTALELLGHNDDPATRDLFLRLLSKEDDSSLLETAMTSARRLWGADSLEPDYAALQNPEIEDPDFAEDLLKRACDRGDPRRLFELLPKCPADTQQAISVSLLNRTTPPLAEAEGALSSSSEAAARLAARIIGRAGVKAAGPALAAGLKKWLATWEEVRQKLVQTTARDERLSDVLSPCVAAFLWAAGRLGVGTDTILTAAAARPDDRWYQPIRQAAVAALAALPAAGPVTTALETAAVGNDPAIRSLAASALAKVDPKRASEIAERALADRTSFNRLAKNPDVDVTAILHAAAGQIHYQGVALPHLAARGDVVALAAVANDKKLPEATRMGAVEALARMARQPAEEVLRTIGQSAKEEELRKAAWRGLRRSKRARKQAAEVTT